MLKYRIMQTSNKYKRNSDAIEYDAISEKYPVLISKHIRSILKFEAVRRQFVPSSDEISISGGDPDALSENKYSVFPRLIRRYQNRAALIAADKCFAYCRHCFRKNRLSILSAESENGISDKETDEVCEWLKAEKSITEMLVTGGDPLTLSDSKLDGIFTRLREANASLIIRLGSRALLSQPSRITHPLCRILKKHNKNAPLFFMTHFNHADELQNETTTAIARIRQAGISLFNQCVLLKGINDNADDMTALSRKLLANGIKPYYAFISDRIKGTESFWISPQRALEIEKELRQRLSGLEMPTFAADLPDGGGKVPLVNCYIKASDENGNATLWTPDFKETRKY